MFARTLAGTLRATLALVMAVILAAHVGSPDVFRSGRTVTRETRGSAVLTRISAIPGTTCGAQPTDEGAVYAVAKGPQAVVVTTNQEQTIKAKVVAQETISALGL